jgi:hypothetical protein
MKSVNIRQIVDSSDSVGMFVAQKLVLDETAQVTVEQLHAAYEQFAREHDLGTLKKIELGRKLKPAILSRLHLSQSHDIVPVGRGSKAGRGYRALAIRT